MNPNNPLEGDQFIDPATDRTFYFTGERWVDITSKDSSTCEKEEVPIKLGLTSND